MDAFARAQVKLEAQEQFRNTWRQSRLLLLWRLLGPLLLAMAAVALFFGVRSRSGIAALVGFGVLLPLSLASLIWISFLLIQWYVRIFVLTNRRLIQREGILIRSRVELQLPKVQNASYAAEMVQKWVGLGTVKVETASVGPPFVISHVREAIGISQEILATAEEAKQELSLMDEDQVRRLLSARITQGI